MSIRICINPQNLRILTCQNPFKKLFTRTANVLPPLPKWRHVKMNNNLDLTGADWPPTQKRGLGRTGVLCLGRAPVYVFATLLRPYGESCMGSQTGPEKPSNYRGNAVKRARTRRVCSRFLRTQDCPFCRQSLPRPLPQSVLPLTNPANVSSNPKPSRKCPISEWNRPEPSAKIDAPKD